jgi:hypothetical protein
LLSRGKISQRLKGFSRPVAELIKFKLDARRNLGIVNRLS